MDDGFRPDLIFEYEGQEVTAVVLAIVLGKSQVLKRLLSLPCDLYLLLKSEELKVNVMYFAITAGTSDQVEMLLRSGYDRNHPLGDGL